MAEKPDKRETPDGTWLILAWTDPRIVLGEFATEGEADSALAVYKIVVDDPITER